MTIYIISIYWYYPFHHSLWQNSPHPTTTPNPPSPHPPSKTAAKSPRDYDNRQRGNIENNRERSAARNE